MGIFNIKSKKPEYGKLLGVHVDDDVYSYVSLYTTAQKSNKSGLLRDLLHKWVRSSQEQYTRSELINILSAKALEEWNRRWEAYYYKEKSKHEAFSMFLYELQENLKYRGVSKEDTELIIKKVRQTK